MLNAHEQEEFFGEARLMKEIGTHANIVERIFDGYLEGEWAAVGHALTNSLMTKKVLPYPRNFSIQCCGWKKERRKLNHKVLL